MLAVATLIIVMSVMQGFRTTLLDQLLGTNGHAFIQSNEAITDYDRQTLRAVPGVIEAIPVIEMPVFASARGETGMFIRGVRREDLLKIDYVTGADHISAGSFDNFGVGEKGGREIALGSRLASSLGLGAGDPITLISGLAGRCERKHTRSGRFSMWAMRNMTNFMGSCRLSRRSFFSITAQQRKESN